MVDETKPHFIIVENIYCEESQSIMQRLDQYRTHDLNIAFRLLKADPKCDGVDYFDGKDRHYGIPTNINYDEFIRRYPEKDLTAA